MKEQFVLEIHADGLPRLVGPFDSRSAAWAWGAANIVNGESNAAPLVSPEEAAR